MSKTGDAFAFEEEAVMKDTGLLKGIHQQYKPAKFKRDIEPKTR